MLPGIFDPVVINGIKFIDGVLVDNVPVSALETYKVDRTIAVSVNSPLDYPIYNDNETKWWVRLRKKAGLEKAGLPLDIVIKAIEIMIEKITNINLALGNPDLYIHVDLSGYKLYSFDKYKKIIDIGEKSAQDQIKALL